jgi:hypothetical protein
MRRDAFISDEFMPVFVRSPFPFGEATLLHARSALRLLQASGLHFFMPDYPCLFVFREADLDFEIKARKPDKAGPRDIPVFPRVLKGVNLLRASLGRGSARYSAREIASADTQKSAS